MNPPQVYMYMCLRFCLQQSKTTMATQVTEWPMLIVTPDKQVF